MGQAIIDYFSLCEKVRRKLMGHASFPLAHRRYSNRRKAEVGLKVKGGLWRPRVREIPISPTFQVLRNILISNAHKIYILLSSLVCLSENFMPINLLSQES